MKILLTNDDGIKALGLEALMKAVEKDHDCRIVAPKDERSASSHSISLGQRLRVERSTYRGVKAYAVHGTPVDCIKFALSELGDFKPDLIVSGINQGANTGVSVYYSGTISAAREGVINKVPSIALSLCSKVYRDFGPSQQIAKKLVDAYEAGAIPSNLMLNVNIPPLPQNRIQGIKVTKQAASRFVEEFVPDKKRKDVEIYTLAGEIELIDPDGSSDEEAVHLGWVSMTPLKLDLTDYHAMPSFQKWIENGNREV